MKKEMEHSSAFMSKKSQDMQIYVAFCIAHKLDRTCIIYIIIVALERG